LRFFRVTRCEEARNSGRQVAISVGRHLRMPRLYRGRDIMWWLNRHFARVDKGENAGELEVASAQPSPQLVGRPNRDDLDLRALRDRRDMRTFDRYTV
jgi:putative flavoprotein involved in K+ transport